MFLTSYVLFYASYYFYWPKKAPEHYKKAMNGSHNYA